MKKLDGVILMHEKGKMTNSHQTSGSGEMFGFYWRHRLIKIKIHSSPFILLCSASIIIKNQIRFKPQNSAARSSGTNNESGAYVQQPCAVNRVRHVGVNVVILTLTAIRTHGVALRLEKSKHNQNRSIVSSHGRKFIKPL